MAHIMLNETPQNSIRSDQPRPRYRIYCAAVHSSQPPWTGQGKVTWPQPANRKKIRLLRHRWSERVVFGAVRIVIIHTFQWFHQIVDNSLSLTGNQLKTECSSMKSTDCHILTINNLLIAELVPLRHTSFDSSWKALSNWCWGHHDPVKG